MHARMHTHALDALVPGEIGRGGGPQVSNEASQSPPRCCRGGNQRDEAGTVQFNCRIEETKSRWPK